MYGSIKEEKDQLTAGHVAASMMHAQVILSRETVHEHSRSVLKMHFSAINSGEDPRGKGPRERGPRGSDFRG